MHLISCENYLSPCGTTPALSKVCNENGEVKKGFQMCLHPNARAWESDRFS